MITEVTICIDANNVDDCEAKLKKVLKGHAIYSEHAGVNKSDHDGKIRFRDLKEHWDGIDLVRFDSDLQAAGFSGSPVIESTSEHGYLGGP